MDSAESLFLELKKGNNTAFKQIYQKFWADLYHYAHQNFRNREICEEIVQETFISLWNKNQDLQINGSLRAYLFTTVKFQMLSYLRSLKVRTSYAESFTAYESALTDNSNEENICFADLKKARSIHFTKAKTAITITINAKLKPKICL